MAFGLIMTLVTLAFCEVALRAAQYYFSGTSPTTLLPGYRESRFQLSPFLVFGPRINWQIPGKPNPDTAYFNGQGFRTRELVGAKPAGEFRIIALGGSTTEEVWTEDGLHWPLWAEREIRKSDPGVRVYNSGMSAYTTAHSLIRLAFDVLDYEPDVVLVMHNINDLTVNYRAAIAGLPVDGHYRVPFAQKAFTNDMDQGDIVLSRLWHSASLRLAGRSDIVVPPQYDISTGLRYFKRNLVSLHALAQSSGSRLVLLTMPVCDSEVVYRKVEHDGRLGLSPPLPQDFERFNRDFAAYNEAIREVGAARGVTVIDMNRLLGGSQEWFADIVHYNAAGSKRFGELLATQLSPLIREPIVSRTTGLLTNERHREAR
jgi:lysophospholipase L1-like esterase